MNNFIESGFRRVFVTLTAMFCIIMAVLGESAIRVALGDISVNLGVTSGELNLVMIAYLLAGLLIAPFCSWFSSLLGRKNFLLVAIGFFVAGAFFCGNANVITSLILFRFLQGIGGGAMLILSHTVITESWPVEKRATSQLFVALGLMIGAGLSAPAGGYITDNFGWLFVFFANIPLGVIAGVLVLVFVRNGSYTPGSWSNVLANSTMWAGIALSFVLAFFTAFLGNMVNTTVVFLHNPFLSTFVILTVMLVLAALILDKKKDSLPYVVAIGLLIFGITGYFAVKGWNIMELRSVGMGILSLSVSAMVVSKLEGQEIGKGIALYHIARLVGSALGFVFFSIYAATGNTILWIY
ncbi:MFS transporter [Chitinophaga sancti]|uniref:MFS transporter n=1 Tax=Chitinophaga sancti TaxID=1004 RepID=A0A1K1RT06_9BACT|nr:MFS transporter [Chitinophaga sancti]WQD62455.1 MFS transporter [Chitinophaga sancti]WQG91976.1 MFS transporter [Chitinophaga sancti]SFW75010.1 Major Facilitator Superfamily protein [Chitinophaga sancti]